MSVNHVSKKDALIQLFEGRIKSAFTDRCLSYNVIEGKDPPGWLVPGWMHRVLQILQDTENPTVFGAPTTAHEHDFVEVKS